MTQSHPSESLTFLSARSFSVIGFSLFLSQKGQHTHVQQAGPFRRLICFFLNERSPRVYVRARSLARVITRDFCSLQIDEKESKRVGKRVIVAFMIMLLSTETTLHTLFYVFSFVIWFWWDPFNYILMITKNLCFSIEINGKACAEIINSSKNHWNRHQIRRANVLLTEKEIWFPVKIFVAISPN